MFLSGRTVLSFGWWWQPSLLPAAHHTSESDGEVVEERFASTDLSIYLAETRDRRKKPQIQICVNSARQVSGSFSSL